MILVFQSCLDGEDCLAFTSLLISREPLIFLPLFPPVSILYRPVYICATLPSVFIHCLLSLIMVFFSVLGLGNIITFKTNLFGLAAFTR